MLRKTILCAIVAALFTTPAWALTLSIEGAGNMASARDGNGNDYPAKLGFGGGAELSFMLGSSWSLDVGGLYLQRKIDLNLAAPSTGDREAHGIEIPVIARYWVGNILSLGAGAYYFRYGGDLKTTTTTGGVTSTQEQSFDSANLADTDYGAVASIRFDIPMGLMTGFVVDGRYTYGLKDNATAGSSLKFREVQGLVGLRFGFMK